MLGDRNAAKFQNYLQRKKNFLKMRYLNKDFYIIIAINFI